MDTRCRLRRAASFLAQQDKDGRVGDALMRNLRYVARRAAPFAQQPVVANLISLTPGTDAGQWRDSGDGLGGGRYPYDVNAILTPAGGVGPGRVEQFFRLAHEGLLAVTRLTISDLAGIPV